MNEARSASGPAGARLRVALVGTYPIDEDRSVQGGIQSVTRELAHALARRPDVECHVVSMSIEPQTHYRRVGDLHVHYVRQARRFGSVTSRLFDRPALSRAVRALQPDIVHGQGQDRHSLGALAAGYPTIVTPHGVLFIENRAFRRHRFDLVGRLKVALLDAAERDVFRLADHMILISRYLPETYGSMLRAPSTFIDNPINPRYFDIARAPEPGRLLFVGSIVPRKCVPHLVLAVDRLRHLLGGAGGNGVPAALPFRLRIVGPWLDPEVERDVRRLIGQRQLESHIEILGPIGEEALFDEYQRADLLLLTSREETSPQVIAQAMACGLPTVAARSGGVPAMIEHGRTGMLFPFGDAAACAACIYDLLRDRQHWQRLSSQVRDEARSRFHADAVAQRTVQTYREVLRRS